MSRGYIPLLQRNKGSVSVTSKFAWVDTAVKAMGLLSVAALGISISYDYGMLLALGVDFSSISTSIGDHARSALIWAPPTFAMLLLGLFVDHIFTARAHHTNKNENEIQATVPGKNVDGTSRWPSPLFLAVVIACLAFFFVVFAFIENSFGWLFIGTAFAVSCFVTGEPFGKPMESRVGGFLLIYICLSFLIGGFGYNYGAHLINIREPQLTVVLKSDNTRIELIANGLRRYSAISLIILKGERVLVVPNDRILETRNATLAKTRD